MHSVIFADDKKFIFTRQQILLIPYFNTLITSSSFLEKDIINISSSSIGFEYIHMYATMDEIDIIDPNDKYLFVIKQCDYFGYDKLKTLLEEKYGYKTDITDAKEKTGKESTVKIKYLGKIKINKDTYPMNYIEQDSYGNIVSKPDKINLLTYFNKHTYYTFDWESNGGGFKHKQLISKKCTCGKGCDNSIFKHNFYYSCGKRYGMPSNYDNILPNIGDNIYHIIPLYEYPEFYSTDEEISDIFKKRYR